MNKKQKEYIFLHAARIFACIAVVIIHAVNVEQPLLGKNHSINWWFANIGTSFSIWAVPLFVMISGALLLQPGKKETPKEFYAKRLRRVGLPALIWIPFYFIFDHFYRGDSLSISFLTWRILHSSFDHLYFLILILELYAITPTLRVFIKTLEKKYMLNFVLIFIFIAIFCKPSSFTFTMFVPYIGYYLLGAYLLEKKIRKKYMPFLGALFLITATAIVFVTYQFPLLDTYSHASPLVILLTTFMFLLIQHGDASRTFVKIFTKERIFQVSSTTFGIYILHPFVLSMALLFLKIFLHITSASWFLRLLFIPYMLVCSYVLTRIIKSTYNIFTSSN